MYTRYLAHNDRDYDLALYEVKKFDEYFLNKNKYKFKNEKKFYKNWLNSILPLNDDKKCLSILSLNSVGYDDDDDDDDRYFEKIDLYNSFKNANFLMDLIEVLDNDIKFKRLKNKNSISNINNIVMCLNYLNKKFLKKFSNFTYNDFINADKKKILSFLFLIKYFYESSEKIKKLNKDKNLNVEMIGEISHQEEEQIKKIIINNEEIKNESIDYETLNSIETSDIDDLKESGFETETESLTFDTPNLSVDVVQVLNENNKEVTEDVHNVSVLNSYSNEIVKNIFICLKCEFEKVKKFEIENDDIPDTKIDLSENEDTVPLTNSYDDSESECCANENLLNEYVDSVVNKLFTDVLENKEYIYMDDIDNISEYDNVNNGINKLKEIEEEFEENFDNEDNTDNMNKIDFKEEDEVRTGVINDEKDFCRIENIEEVKFSEQIENLINIIDNKIEFDEVKVSNIDEIEKPKIIDNTAELLFEGSTVTNTTYNNDEENLNEKTIPSENISVPEKEEKLNVRESIFTKNNDTEDKEDVIMELEKLIHEEENDECLNFDEKINNLENENIKVDYSINDDKENELKSIDQISKAMNKTITNSENGIENTKNKINSEGNNEEFSLEVDKIEKQLENIDIVIEDKKLDKINVNENNIKIDHYEELSNEKCNIQEDKQNQTDIKTNEKSIYTNELSINSLEDNNNLSNKIIEINDSIQVKNKDNEDKSLIDIENNKFKNNIESIHDEIKNEKIRDNNNEESSFEKKVNEIEKIETELENNNKINDKKQIKNKQVEVKNKNLTVNIFNDDSKINNHESKTEDKNIHVNKHLDESINNQNQIINNNNHINNKESLNELKRSNKNVISQSIDDSSNNIKQAQSIIIPESKIQKKDSSKNIKKENKLESELQTPVNKNKKQIPLESNNTNSNAIIIRKNGQIIIGNKQNQIKNNEDNIEIQSSKQQPSIPEKQTPKNKIQKQQHENNKNSSQHEKPQDLKANNKKNSNIIKQSILVNETDKTVDDFIEVTKRKKTKNSIPKKQPKSIQQNINKEENVVVDDVDRTSIKKLKKSIYNSYEKLKSNIDNISWHKFLTYSFMFIFIILFIIFQFQ